MGCFHAYLAVIITVKLCIIEFKGSHLLCGIRRIGMLSDKQGSFLAMLLTVSVCYIPFLLANLIVMQWPLAWFAATLEFNPNPWAIAVLCFVIACDLLSIVWVTILAVRKFKGQLPTVRFYLLTVILFITFLALSYVAIVMANVALNMGWSVL
jgi:hypothetical protein